MTIVSSSVNDRIHNYNTLPDGKNNSIWKAAGIGPTHLSSTITNLVSKGVLEQAIYGIPDILKKPGA
jgi:hypothetical protein